MMSRLRHPNIGVYVDTIIDTITQLYTIYIINTHISYDAYLSDTHIHIHLYTYSARDGHLPGGPGATHTSASAHASA
jgi:hypothetical protein